MVQEQLTDYISSQMKLGVSRDAIKSALVSAGWVAGDVEDTLNAAGKSGSASASIATTAASAAATSAKPMTGATMGSNPQTSSPQMIKVSDLVSSPFSGSTSSAKPTAATSAGQTNNAAAAKFGGTIKGNSFEASPSKTVSSSSAASFTATSASSAKTGGKGALIMEIIGVILILALAGLAWYFYSGNAALAAKVTSLNTQSASVTAQMNTLQSEVAASSTADQVQIADLTAANTDLALNLSFYAVPLGTPTSTAMTPIPVTLSGTVSGGGKAPYAVTTPRGSKIFIANSSDATIAPELKASLGQTVQLSGTYIEGSDQMTVSSVATTTPATQ
jgi:hypothetical protein